MEEKRLVGMGMFRSAGEAREEETAADDHASGRAQPSAQRTAAAYEREAEASIL
jgi:hypothetical protein